jgi:head-tail adaptor
MEEVMSLMDDYVASCVKLVRESTADGEGGFSTVWKDGNSFQAVITLNSSAEVTKAEKKSEASTYIVTVTRSLDLNYHDVFKRLTDGKVFRVTSDGTDKKTPERATLDMRQVTAEEWELT